MALSPEVKEAANHILSHAQGIRATLVLAEAVESVNLIDQAATEAERRKAAAIKEKADAEAKLVEVNGDIDKARKKLADIREDGRNAKADADARAAQIIADAKAEGTRAAVQITGRATTEAASVDKATAAARATLSELEAEIAAQQETLEAIRAEQAEVVKKADRARAYLAELAEK